MKGPMLLCFHIGILTCQAVREFLNCDAFVVSCAADQVFRLPSGFKGITGLEISSWGSLVTYGVR